ncbi:MAG: UDP-glucose 4-epimerase GalE [Chlamydiae bacterium CG10_big_fil_rev_8_21_14_0_10_42_34]|nr:MAG: UDP-glucose 4-epimerase GalE [Chlamydiae bacterium CG10_big_fil_rev_8_21_14_0_10_42_34]
MKETILVTGGAGYIGSHTCKALAKAGYTPVVFDNLSTGHAYAIKWGPFVQGDLSDKTKLDEAFSKFKPKAVIHFAADALVVESINNPGKYYRNNIAGTISLLEAMRDHEVKKLVFSSSCATYGQPQFNPITEKHPQSPINPYGRTKLMAEQIFADFEAAHAIQAINLRYFNAAGADLETQIGENHAPETHLIPVVIQAALGLREEVVVYGTDFETKDGSAVRDYVHVQDLANAHVSALKCEKSASINLGTGTGHSVLEIIDAVQKYCGKEISVRLEARRLGEPGILTADNSKAKELLNWVPETSDLPTLIESAWKWHQLLFENAHLVRTVLKC